MISWPSSGPDRVKLPGPWHASPYLHVFDHAIFNPHEGRGLGAEHPWYQELKGIIESGSVIDHLEDVTRALAADGWLIPVGLDLSHHYRIRYVSLEAGTVCNQRCHFCPVSIKPRPAMSMSSELYERIISEIVALEQPIEAVAMNQYNEPTIDPRFVDQVRLMIESGLPVAVFSNGSGLTPKVTDSLIALGGLRYLSVNLSTLDREQYRHDRGRDHLDRVLTNLDYAKDRAVAEEMVLTVLNEDREALDRTKEAIGKRFGGSNFTVQDWIVNDRAGNVAIGIGGIPGLLAGCDYMGSRPIEHIHITAQARVVLCCQDYDERWVAGNLHEANLEAILSGPDFARLRRTVYGLEEAPEGFLCSSCRYAIHRPGNRNDG